jgi:predicted nucleic acid-binding protein
VHRFYLDASALAKRYAKEQGSAVINHLFASISPERLTVLNVGIAEVVSILVRKANAGQMSQPALQQVLRNVNVELIQATTLDIVVADNALVFAALRFIKTHSINSTDSIILRSAADPSLRLRASSDDVDLIASDQRLLKAAKAEGLKTFNPETQSQVDLASFLAP